MSTITTEDFFIRCQRHDWYYDFSDDGRIYRSGQAESDALHALMVNNPVYTAIYTDFVKWYNKEGKKPDLKDYL